MRRSLSLPVAKQRGLAVLAAISRHTSQASGRGKQGGHWPATRVLRVPTGDRDDHQFSVVVRCRAHHPCRLFTRLDDQRLALHPAQITPILTARSIAQHRTVASLCIMITVAVAIRGRRPCKGVEASARSVPAQMARCRRESAAVRSADWLNVPKCQRSAPFVQVTMVLAAVLNSAPIMISDISSPGNQAWLIGRTG